MVEVEVDIEEDGGDNGNTGLTPVGHFLTDRPIRTHIMKEHMARVLRSGRGVLIGKSIQVFFSLSSFIIWM